MKKVLPKWTLKISLIGGALLTSACSHLFFYPDSRVYVPVLESNSPPQVVRFASLDGTELDSWFFPGQKGEEDLAPHQRRGTVVQFHGNAQNISSHFLSLVWIQESGYNFFTFDYRGYGQSQGRAGFPGVVEDGRAALHQAWKLHQEHSPEGLFVVVGQSLGGAIALRALELEPDLAERLDLIVMDSSFSSYQQVAFHALRSHWVTWFLSPLAFVLINNRHGEKSFLKSSTTPLLVLHDRKDPVVPFKMGEKIYRRAGNPIGFWAPEQGHHMGAFFESHSPFRQKFLDLMDSLDNSSSH